MKVFKQQLAAANFVLKWWSCQTSTGSALVYYGDTTVLSVVTSKEDDMDRDFFPQWLLSRKIICWR